MITREIQIMSNWTLFYPGGLTLLQPPRFWWQTVKHHFTKVFVSPILLHQQAGCSPDSRWHSWDASQWLLLAGQTIAGSARDQLGYSGMTTQRDYSWRLQPKPRDQ